MDKKILVILGSTAVGKSALAVRLAKKLNGEVISADSRQVYRGLNIGTGKITEKEMLGVPHHLLDVISPKKQFSAADFVLLGRAVIADTMARGHIPIICGGTGFYIDALLGKISLPSVPPNPKLRAKLEKKSASELFAMLKKLIPTRAKTIDRNNSRRLIRAIEVAKNSKKSAQVRPAQFAGLTCAEDSATIIKIGLTLSPEKLKEKIRLRLLSRLRSGMIAEVVKLHHQGLSWKRMEELGLEYRYIARFLQKKMTEREMIEKLNTEIWHYAKRQMTWFKRDKDIDWFKPKETRNIIKTTEQFLDRKKRLPWRVGVV